LCMVYIYDDRKFGSFTELEVNGWCSPERRPELSRACCESDGSALMEQVGWRRKKKKSLVP
jgi:hypothetical protein